MNGKKLQTLIFLAERKDLQENDLRVALVCVGGMVRQVDIVNRLEMKKQNVNKSIKKLLGKKIIKEDIWEMEGVSYFSVRYEFNFDYSEWEFDSAVKLESLEF